MTKPTRKAGVLTSVVSPGAEHARTCIFCGEELAQDDRAQLVLATNTPGTGTQVLAVSRPACGRCLHPTDPQGVQSLARRLPASLHTLTHYLVPEPETPAGEADGD